MIRWITADEADYVPFLTACVINGSGNKHILYASLESIFSRTGEDTKFQAHFCFCVLGEGVIWDGSYSWPDAKAALLSFFRSLVFGTVPEAISKLSLEGVGLKREKKMCVIKPIFFQDGEGKYV